MGKEIEVTSTPYGILTVNQLCSQEDMLPQWAYDQTGGIDKKRGGAKLNLCYPFPDSTKKKDVQTGPKFIIKDEKYLDRLKDAKLLRAKRRKKEDKAKQEAGEDSSSTSDEGGAVGSGPMGATNPDDWKPN